MALINKNQFIEADAIKKELNEIIALFDKSEQAIKDITKASRDLQKATKAVQQTGSGKEAQERINLTSKLNQATKDLTDTQKRKKQLDLERLKLLNNLKKANSDRIQQSVEIKVQLQEQNKINKQAARETLKLVGAYEKLTKSTNEAQKKFKNLAAQHGVNSKQAKKARIEFDKLDNELRSVNNAAKDGRRDVGRYGTALKGVGRQLLGAAGIVGGVDLLIQGFQKFAETSKQVNDLTRKIGTNFNLTNRASKNLAARINGLAETFDQDYNQILIAANAVSKEFGITGQEATKLIEEGFLKGSDNSGEFLDILREYPVQFKKAGLSAAESFAIINQQVTAGVYSDKGVDAIKEGGLSLVENTKAVQAALQAALAPLEKTVRLEVQRLAATGESFEAMQLLSTAMKDSNLTAAQTQTIMADIFKGAGEDAESFVLNLDKVKLSLDDVAIQASESQQANLKLSQSWSRFVTGVSDSDGIFGKTFAAFKNLLAGAINGLSTLIELLKGGPKAVDGIAIAIENLKKKQEEQTVATIDEEKATQRLINANGDLVDGNGKLIKSKSDLEKASRARAKAIKDENKKLLKQIKLQQDLVILRDRDITSTDTEEDSFAKQEEAAAASLALTEDTESKRAEIILKFQDSALEEQLKKEISIEEAKKELIKSTIDEVASFFTDTRQQRTESEIEAINQEAEAEKEILRQNLEQGLINEQEFKTKSAEIDKKARKDAAKAEKKGTLFNIGINTAAGIIKALASSPPPLNFINAGLIAAQGAIQAALVAATPLPAFKDGVIGFKGKGTGTSDSNPVKISNNESIITERGTLSAPIALDAINRGLLSDSDINVGLTKSQSDGLNASRLYQGIIDGNNINANMLTALLNGLGSLKPGKEFDTYTNARGEVERIYKVKIN